MDERIRNITPKERKVNVDIEIAKLLVKGGMKSIVTPYLQELIKVRSRRIALCRVIDLMFNGIHLTKVIRKVSMIYRQYVIDVVCEVVQRCQTFMNPEFWIPEASCNKTNQTINLLKINTQCWNKKKQSSFANWSVAKNLNHHDTMSWSWWLSLYMVTL